jgi:hypothetical protein
VIQAAEYKVFAQAAESNLTVCQAAEGVPSRVWAKIVVQAAWKVASGKECAVESASGGSSCTAENGEERAERRESAGRE